MQKTMVVVEGVARKLDPHLNMWATAEPVVGGWIADNLGPRGRLEDLGRGVSRLVQQIGDSPQRLEKLGRWIDRWEERPPDYSQPPPSRVGGISLWLIALTLIWIAFRVTFAR